MPTNGYAEFLLIIIPTNSATGAAYGIATKYIKEGKKIISYLKKELIFNVLYIFLAVLFLQISINLHLLGEPDFLVHVIVTSVGASFTWSSIVLSAGILLYILKYI